MVVGSSEAGNAEAEPGFGAAGAADDVSAVCNPRVVEFDP